MVVIQPFRPQGARELDAALLVMRVRPWLTLLCALAALFALAFAWSRLHNRWPRALLASAAALTVLAAVASRVNIFEMMFNPLAKPAFASATGAKLDPGEMVLAVRHNGAARAYPVRALAYHHIVNDMVDGRPLVVTY
jgi:hypothetical protein